MLIRYKRSYEKIAMGLLSFVPSEKDLKKLQQTIKKYEEEENWQLFLWKDEDIIGIVGIKVDETENKAILQHVSVNPSYRGQGIGRQMVNALLEMLGPDTQLTSSDLINEFYNKCLKAASIEE